MAIKVQRIKPEYMADIEEEYKILRDLSSHPNLPDFYGAYKKSDDDGEKIWFVMQVRSFVKIRPLSKCLGNWDL